MNDLKLVEQVREHPCLYDVNHEYNKDCIARTNVWHQIGAALQQPPEECKSRWRNIKDTFMRRKRIQTSSTESCHVKRQRKWQLEDSLMFLNNVECERKKNTTQNTNTENSQEMEIKMERDQHYAESSGFSESISETNAVDVSTEIPSATAEIIKQDIIITPENNDEGNLQEPYADPPRSSSRQESEEKLMEHVLALMKKNSDKRTELLSRVLESQENMHPVDLFLKSMGYSIKKLSPQGQVRAKMQICNIVGKIELEEMAGCL